MGHMVSNESNNNGNVLLQGNATSLKENID